MLFSAAIDEFLKVLAAGRYSPHTLNSYRRTLGDLGEHVSRIVGHEPEADEITRDLIVAHGRERMGHLGRRSMDHRLYTLRSFFTWLNAAHGIENPLRGMIMPRPMPRPLVKVITPEQIAAIIGAGVARYHLDGHDLRDRALIEFLYSSGCRISEAIALNWEDLEGGEPGDVRITAGKGGDDRVVLAAEPARDALEAWRRVAWVKDLGAPIFQNKSGERLTVRSMELMVRNRTARAGIDQRVYPHLFRHSFATHMMERGAGLADIGKLLGHANLNSTVIYTHTSMEYLHRQLKHHPRERRPANPRAVAVRPNQTEGTMSFRESILGEIEKVKAEAKVAARRLGFKSLRHAPWIELDYWDDQRLRSDAVRSRVKCLRALLVVTDPVVAVDQGGYRLGEIGARIDRDLKILRENLPKAAPPTPSYLIAQWTKEMDARRAALR
jgi:integrase/recombinase XerC